MAGPAIVVVAGCFTAWLAVSGEDGLVVDDYYKQGLAINQTLVRDETAGRLGVRAELHFTDGQVRVSLGDAGVRGKLSLRLVHPTRAGMDQNLDMAMLQPGLYEGQAHAVQPGRWHVVLEDRDWRLTGDWVLPAAGALILGGRSQTPAGAGTPIEDER
jgi:hypothetical protein